MRSKHFIFFALAFFILLITSCKESKLRKCVDEINQKCPYSYGSWGKLTSVQYDDKNVIYTCLVNDDDMDFEAIKENLNIYKRSIITSLVNSPLNGEEEFINLIHSAHAGIIFNYIGNPSGNVLTITLSSEEIASMHNEAGENDYRAALQAQVDMTNALCPFDADEGIRITRVTLEDDSLVYIALVDESLYSISIMKEMESEIKQSIMEGLITDDDPSTAYLLNLCKLANVGIAYRYEGNVSHDVLTIKITPSEFKDVDINAYMKEHLEN